MVGEDSGCVNGLQHQGSIFQPHLASLELPPNDYTPARSVPQYGSPIRLSRFFIISDPTPSQPKYNSLLSIYGPYPCASFSETHSQEVIGLRLLGTARSLPILLYVTNTDPPHFLLLFARSPSRSDLLSGSLWCNSTIFTDGNHPLMHIVGPENPCP